MNRLNLHVKEYYPLLGIEFKMTDYIPFDLNAQNPDLIKIVSQKDLAHYIENYRSKYNQSIPYGGYGEKRSLYRSTLFHAKGEPRDIHLGIDVWMKSDTELFAPLDGVVESVKYNNNGLDYGYTLIIEHSRTDNQKFYSLIGHMSRSVKDLWAVGKAIKKGSLMGHIGDINENGGWVPHVHYQLMFDLEGNKGDYPGVCKESEKEKYLTNCPNPMNIILPGE